MVAVEAVSGVRPLSTDRVPAQDGQPEVGEEGDRRFEVTDGDPTFSILMGMRCTLLSRQ